MLLADVTTRRLKNIGLLEPYRDDITGAVSRLAAVQAQDYYAAQWSVGQRLSGIFESDLEAAFNQGHILRTHLLRPTWHFVAATDVRWLLRLTAPRVHAANAYRYRQLELKEDAFELSNRTIAEALRGGRHMTRRELGRLLVSAGIPHADGQRLAYLVMFAELEGIVCSGPRRGKQFTYALLDERAPVGRRLNPEAAKAELADRFFTTRGPATAKDFAKWSGLTIASARSAIEAASSSLQSEAWKGRTYWYPQEGPIGPKGQHSAHLLSLYDEYLSSYADRSALVDRDLERRLWTMGNAVHYVFFLDGRLHGTWSRRFSTDAVELKLSPAASLPDRHTQALNQAADRYGAFFGRRARLIIGEVLVS